MVPRLTSADYGFCTVLVPWPRSPLRCIREVTRRDDSGIHLAKREAKVVRWYLCVKCKTILLLNGDASAGITALVTNRTRVVRQAGY